MVHPREVSARSLGKGRWDFEVTIAEGRKREVRRLCDHARSLLEGARVAPLEAGESLVGTGGTLRNLAKVDLRSRDYPVSRLHGYTLTRKRLK